MCIFLTFRCLSSVYQDKMPLEKNNTGRNTTDKISGIKRHGMKCHLENMPWNKMPPGTMLWDDVPLNIYSFYFTKLVAKENTDTHTDIHYTYKYTNIQIRKYEYGEVNWTAWHGRYTIPWSNAVVLARFHHCCVLKVPRYPPLTVCFPYILQTS